MTSGIPHVNNHQYTEDLNESLPTTDEVEAAVATTSPSPSCCEETRLVRLSTEFFGSDGLSSSSNVSGYGDESAESRWEQMNQMEQPYEGFIDESKAEEFSSHETNDDDDICQESLHFQDILTKFSSKLPQTSSADSEYKDHLLETFTLIFGESSERSASWYHHEVYQIALITASVYHSTIITRLFTELLDEGEESQQKQQLQQRVFSPKARKAFQLVEFLKRTDTSFLKDQILAEKIFEGLLQTEASWTHSDLTFAMIVITFTQQLITISDAFETLNAKKPATEISSSPRLPSSSSQQKELEQSSSTIAGPAAISSAKKAKKFAYLCSKDFEWKSHVVTMIALRYPEIASALSRKKRQVELQLTSSASREDLRQAISSYCEVKIGYADVKYDLKNIKKHLPIPLKTLINQLLFQQRRHSDSSTSTHLLAEAALLGLDSNDIFWAITQAAEAKFYTKITLLFYSFDKLVR